MKTVSTLPEGYKQILNIDLSKDKKLALLVNVMAILIGVLMAVPMNFYLPITTLFSFEKGVGDYFLRFGVLVFGTILYIILHEFTHGITMKMCGTKKIKYGFTGLYAFANSNDYYGKRNYIIIALAPVVVWGIILGVVNLFVAKEWFWVVYWIQISNISGAAGDLYVTLKFLKLPKDIYIGDSGTAMKVYSK